MNGTLFNRGSSNVYSNKMINFSSAPFQKISTFKRRSNNFKGILIWGDNSATKNERQIYKEIHTTFTVEANFGYKLLFLSFESEVMHTVLCTLRCQINEPTQAPLSRIRLIKVSKFQNELVKPSFLPKYEPNIVRISALKIFLKLVSDSQFFE